MKLKSGDDKDQDQNQQKPPAVVKIADRNDCQWHSRSFKVDDFYFIWKGVCDFLLVIINYLGPIFHHFRDTAAYSLKHFIENCGQTAAYEDMVTIDGL